MDYVLVPRGATQTTVDVWVGAFGCSPERLKGQDAVLVVGGKDFRVPGWDVIPGCPSFAHAQVPVTAGSKPGEVTLRVGGKKTEATTLVSALPSNLAEPFRVVLGSCFEPSACSGGRLKRAVEVMARHRPPNVKLLCGDQVYLDPPLCLSRCVRSHEHHALSIYRRTWTHTGFRELLSGGANYFCPDDHDLWNDYTTTRGSLQEDRETAAKELLAAFQGRHALQAFSVGRLRFLVVDTRRWRTEPSDPNPRFMDEQDLEKVLAWLGSSEGPGVLILGQPLFGELGYGGSHGSDIPQYRRQFRMLAEGILDAPCSVMILSGDLHFGRVACGRNRRGQELVEVISSPLGLSFLRNAAGRFRPWRPALGAFPDPALGPGVPISTLNDYRISRPHFVTLDFSEGEGGKVSVDVRSWPIKPTSVPPGRSILVADL